MAQNVASSRKSLTQLFAPHTKITAHMQLSDHKHLQNYKVLYIHLSFVRQNQSNFTERTEAQ